jgi:hypothetical protein
MDRETVLKHSRAVRLDNKALSDFTDLIAELCTIRGCSEHLSAIIQLLQNPSIGGKIIDAVLEYFEKEYHIIKIEKITFSHNTVFGNIEQKQLITIY